MQQYAIWHTRYGERLPHDELILPIENWDGFAIAFMVGSKQHLVVTQKGEFTLLMM
jgi:hypothetical protein